MAELRYKIERGYVTSASRHFVAELSGWAFVPGTWIKRLYIRKDETTLEVDLYGIERPDVRAKEGGPFSAGFFASFAFAGSWDVILGVDCGNGDFHEVYIDLEQFNFRHTYIPPVPSVPTPETVVLLPTYKPRLDLFQKQIDSLRDQTYQDWHCLVVDDGSGPEFEQIIRGVVGDDLRFTLAFTPKNVGVYRNFERALMACPACTYVSLCDQDDRWYPDKLERLVELLKSKEYDLVYSDMRIVSESGKILSNSFWVRRKNQWYDLASLLVANTVTGAASLFRFDLIERALPFPGSTGKIYHDHWLALVALACRGIGFIDEPLYDYIQHADQDIGHTTQKISQFGYDLENVKSIFQIIYAYIFRSKYNSLSLDVYVHDMARLKLCASVIYHRFNTGLYIKRSNVLKMFASSPSWQIVKALAWRGFVRVGRFNDTLGNDLRLLNAALRARLGLIGRRRMTYTGAANQLRAVVGGQSNIARGIRQVEELQHKTSPIKSIISLDEPVRVNFLLPTIDAGIVFAGYIVKFSLIHLLTQLGYRVRLLLVDAGSTATTSDKINAVFAGVGITLRFPVSMEVVDVANRKTFVRFSERDKVIATTWWTAHVANELISQLKTERFTYLIQDYEPDLFERGSFYSYARQSYRFNHNAIYSTEILSSYFKRHGIGAHADPDALHMSIQIPMSNVRVATEADIQTRAVRKLLFYARPAPHAARNAFALGVIALKKAIASGVFDARWQFFGVGTEFADAIVDLGTGRFMTILSKMRLDEYANALADYDGGLFIMQSPHPGLFGMELAAAGVPTLFVPHEEITESELRDYCENILVSNDDLDKITKGLADIVLLADDEKTRVSNAASTRWPKSFDVSYSPAVVERICELIGPTVN